MPALLPAPEEAQDVQAQIYFLKRDQMYEVEKSYSLEFDTMLFAPSNIKTHVVSDLPIKDIRGMEDEFSFEKNGFAVLELNSKMTYEDFDDIDKIKKVYSPEVAAALLHYMGASGVQVFDAQIRRRHPEYPYGNLIQGVNNQPAVRAHVDASPGEVNRIIGYLNEPEDAERLRKGRYIYLNFWKPLRGPVRDWPLAVCDGNTVDKSDLIPHDSVFAVSPVNVRENMLVHYNEKHKWYYLSQQRSNEVMIFRQSDSEGKLGVPHGSFHNPCISKTDNSEPRESIEIRAVVYFDD